MDPKIAKKTQDSLGKHIKKPPLTEKLLSKPPFRFLHDVMTSVIKTTGVMEGLFSEAEMNSENVKDKDSKIAFLQKAIDYVAAASGKQLGVKPAKVVAGHEPEKTNEFLQALASAIGSKVNNSEVLDSMNGKGGKSSKKVEKEEKPKEKERDKSSDRRKRDEEKRGRDRGEDKERSRDRDDRKKDRDDKHRDREDRHKDREDRHKDRDDRHKDREDRHKDRDRERGKSGRSRPQKENNPDGNNFDDVLASCATPNDVDSDLMFSDNEMDDGTLPGNATFAVLNPSRALREQDMDSSPPPLQPIQRQISTYQELKPSTHYNVGRDEYAESGDTETTVSGPPRIHKVRRPKGARLRRHQLRAAAAQDSMDSETPSSPFTPYVSEEENIRGSNVEKEKNHADAIVDKLDELDRDKKSKKKKSKSGKGKPSDHPPVREKVGSGKYPKTSTPNDSPLSPRTDHNKQVNVSKRDENETPIKGKPVESKQKQSPLGKVAKAVNKVGNEPERNLKKMASSKKHNRKSGKKTEDIDQKENEAEVRNSLEYESQNVISATVDKSGKNKSARERLRSQDAYYNEENVSPKKAKDKVKYRNDDYEHEKMKKSKRKSKGSAEVKDNIESHTSGKDGQEAYYLKKQPHGVDDKRKRSSFMSLSEKHRREEQEKENDAPNENMVNGEHKTSDAPAKIQRPTSAKGSRRRMEDVPSAPGKREPSSTFGDDDVPPQVAAGRLARPSSARPAPPKRKEDVAQSEPAMRLGSGKPQNLILDDGKDSDEDETFVVEESANQPIEPEQPQAPLDDDDDEDHGGLVKKIMESKKEYEQPRETKIERPTISDAQRRKQREAVQREIDKLRGSIQTLTRSANPLGKIMDYVQEDLDSMQKELEKWKEENKEHALALRREKAITERAVEPLRVQLSEVDQAIKDQLELIGAVKSNIIRNDQKMEKMLRTIAKS